MIQRAPFQYVKQSDPFSDWNWILEYCTGLNGSEFGPCHTRLPQLASRGRGVFCRICTGEIHGGECDGAGLEGLAVPEDFENGKVRFRCGLVGVPWLGGVVGGVVERTDGRLGRRGRV
ncbi:hypothetical protein EAF00_004021 [Botryotinia globosa]|nr:hypothetical protein EAF00_004021 [Botryotinia globosa]